MFLLDKQCHWLSSFYALALCAGCWTDIFFNPHTFIHILLMRH